MALPDRILRAFGLDPVRDVQVLCPMNRGGVGARSLNVELQKVLNPPGEVRVEQFGLTYSPGDKVMKIENDYAKEVYNGDLGIVARIDMEASELVATFDGREVVYGFGEFDKLVLACATTIHKAQGSEYPAVVIPVMLQHYTIAGTQSTLYGCDPGQKARRAGWAAQGHRHGDPERRAAPALVEAAGVASDVRPLEEASSDATCPPARCKRPAADRSTMGPDSRRVDALSIRGAVQRGRASELTLAYVSA